MFLDSSYLAIFLRNLFVLLIPTGYSITWPIVGLLYSGAYIL